MLETTSGFSIIIIIIIKWSYDPCSYECSFRNCVGRPWKIQRSLSPSPRDAGAMLQLNELWGRRWWEIGSLWFRKFPWWMHQWMNHGNIWGHGWLVPSVFGFIVQLVGVSPASRGRGFNSVENFRPPCAIAKAAFITARFHLISYLQFNILFAWGSWETPFVCSLLFSKSEAPSQEFLPISLDRFNRKSRLINFHVAVVLIPMLPLLLKQPLSSQLTLFPLLLKGLGTYHLFHL